MIGSPSEHESDSLPRRQTDPAWLQDHYLGTGHTEDTSSATFTFIKRRGRIYAVTCGHVLDALGDPQSVPDARLPTLALHIDRSVLNLSSAVGLGQISHAVKAAEPEGSRREVDIAIAPLSESYWSLLSEKKNKTAIDLDAWQEPRWDAVKFCMAAGYPNEHKERVEADGRDMVGAPFMCSVAEATSKLGREQPFITLSSQLDDPHGYFFSGMSGGPVYAVEGAGERLVEDHELLPVGIIFEGAPGSGRRGVPEGGDPAAAFLTDRDIFFRALTLTPESFDDWLKQTNVT